MTTPHRTLLQQALDALDNLGSMSDHDVTPYAWHGAKAEAACAALREALAEPGPEPVAWKHDCAALCTNDVELWIDACPHCGKPRTAPPAAPASQWMPIETAPKDSLYEDGENRYGRRILVWGNGYDEPMRARWWFRIDSNRQNFISDAGFAVFPTHWMPLPAAPDHLRDVAEKAAPAASCAGHHQRTEESSMTTPTLHQAAQMALDAPMPEPAAWKHDCAALCTNDVELWIDACPHCGKPRTAPPAAPAPAAPVVPLTDEQIRSMWLSSEFRGNGGQVDWFCEGIRAAEAHHGITGGSK